MCMDTKRHARRPGLGKPISFPRRLTALRASDLESHTSGVDLIIQRTIWLGDEDSNLGAGIQNPVSYR